MSTRMVIDYEAYTKVTTRDGERHRDDSVATAEQVRMFLNARSFFDNLVDEPETHRKGKDGSIVVTQQSPDGQTQVTRFVPIGSRAS